MEIYKGSPFSGKKTSIKELEGATSQLKNVVIEGRIFMMDDVRGPFGKDNSYLQKGAIWDGESSMYFQFFDPDIIPLKKGMDVKMKGFIEKNKYTQEEWAFMPSAIVEGKMELTEKMDEATKKRVELQTFSFMTTLRGANDVTRYIETAKRFGHEAIGITDKMSAQSFPAAYLATKDDEDFKVVYGMTADVVDPHVPVIFNPKETLLKDTSYVVFDVETTGFSVLNDHIIEIGAAKFKNGELLDTYNAFVKTPKRIPEHIVELTSITNEMVETEGIDLNEAMAAFHAFHQGSILVAHNAQFDRDHLRMAYKRSNMEIPTLTLMDTLMLSRSVNREAKRHGLGNLTKKYKIKLDNHHRAKDDAHATGLVLMKLFEQIEENEEWDIQTQKDLNTLLPPDNYKNDRATEMTIWVKNQKGLKNLYKLISYGHTQYITSGFGRAEAKYPVITWDEIEACREGLILGSGSHLGKVFDYALNKTPDMLKREMEKYDVIEIQPSCVGKHLWHHERPQTDDEACVTRAWQMIYNMAKKLGKEIIATGHVHHADEEDKLIHNMLVYNEVPPKRPHQIRRGKEEFPQGDCHFMTTNEMLNAFDWLGDDEKETIVIDNPNRLVESIDKLVIIPDKLYTPNIDGTDDNFRKMAFQQAKGMYGDPLPKYVHDRLHTEVESIIEQGYAVIYMISQDLVKKSLEDGYLVGSRGSVGSSFAATTTGITEVNPLKPHYLCSNADCKWHLFFDHEEIGSGYDLPSSFKTFLTDKYSTKAQKHVLERFSENFGTTDLDKMKAAFQNHEDRTCPKCKKQTLSGEGQDIPFQIFLGFKGDKVPDIDLNFSGVYQPTAHKYVEEKFGDKYVYRAGTIATVAGKTAYGFVKGYVTNHGLSWSRAEINRIATKLEGAKRSTGQHPGGMLVVPDYMDMEDISAYQYPANNLEAEFKTSHFDFHAIHDNILKLDILGHIAPTIQRLLQDRTNIDPRSIPTNDEKVYKLFYDPEEALGVELSKINSTTGTLGIPEMGTSFVQKMLVETKPKTFAELVKISGLSHGTDVWTGNAQELVNNAVCAFKEVIGCRDDIMVTLQQKGLEDSLAFTIMEFVRKGKGLKPEWIEEMKKYDVPEWYIESCEKIKYMFPKAHASAYVLDAIRIGWFKVYKPLEYYSALFSCRFNEESVKEMLLPSEGVRARMKEVQKEIDEDMKNGEINAANKKQKLLNALNLALEGKERGVKFGTVRLYESHSDDYLIDYENNELIPPFSSIDGIGPTVAEKLSIESKNGVYRGLEDFKNRTGATKTNISVLRQLGCLEDVEEKQHVFF